MKRVNKSYSREFKLLIIKKYLQGDTTLEKLANEFGVPSKTQIYNWVKKFEKDGEKAFKFKIPERHGIKNVYLNEKK